MPRIQLHTTMAGPNGTRAPGIHHVDAETAAQLVAGRFATPLEPPADPGVGEVVNDIAPESASLAAPETAVLPPARKKKG